MLYFVVQKLPRKYVKNHGDELSNPVHLKFRGTEFEMKLKRYKDEAWFDKGWEEFSKSYSFEYNDLLIFGYEGNSTFRVSLFDRTPELKENDFQPSPLPHSRTRTSSCGGKAEIQERAPSLEKSKTKSKATHRSNSELKSTAYRFILFSVFFFFTLIYIVLFFFSAIIYVLVCNCILYYKL
jgi:hypothetical protein